MWDGLAGNEFNSWGTPFKSDRGKLFFPGVEGLTAFFPDKVIDNTYIPPVVLTDFRLFNETVPVGGHSPLKKSISYTDALELSHKQAVVSFEFSALSYIVPEANRYRYKLEGLETQWNDVSSAHRYATYTTLPPGEYVFRVQGSNNRGLWNEQGAECSHPDSASVVEHMVVQRDRWCFICSYRFGVFTISACVLSNAAKHCQSNTRPRFAP